MADGYTTLTLTGGSTTPSGDSSVTVSGDFFIDGLGDTQLVTWGDARINFGNAEASNLIPGGSYGYTISETNPETPGSGIWKIKIPKNTKVLALENFSNITINLTGFDNLESLSLVNCGLTQIPTLTDCIKLKSLNLNDNPIGMSFPSFTDLYSLISLNSVKFENISVLTEQIPDLDAFPDMTEYIYNPQDVKNDMFLNTTDKDWDTISLDWDDLPLVQNPYILKRDTVQIYTGPLHDFQDTGLTSGVSYDYEVSNNYFGNVILGTNTTITDICSPPDPLELGLYVLSTFCDSITYSWNNNWRDTPNRSDLAMTLNLYDITGATLILGPIDVTSLTEYTFDTDTTNTPYKGIMSITKCGTNQDYELDSATDNCEPPSEIELNLRQI